MKIINTSFKKRKTVKSKKYKNLNYIFYLNHIALVAIHNVFARNASLRSRNKFLKCKAMRTHTTTQMMLQYLNATLPKSLKIRCCWWNKIPRSSVQWKRFNKSPSCFSWASQFAKGILRGFCRCENVRVYPDKRWSVDKLLKSLEKYNQIQTLNESHKSHSTRTTQHNFCSYSEPYMEQT